MLRVIKVQWLDRCVLVLFKNTIYSIWLKTGQKWSQKFRVFCIRDTNYTLKLLPLSTMMTSSNGNIFHVTGHRAHYDVIVMRIMNNILLTLNTLSTLNALIKCRVLIKCCSRVSTIDHLFLECMLSADIVFIIKLDFFLVSKLFVSMVMMGYTMKMAANVWCI